MFKTCIFERNEQKHVKLFQIIKQHFKFVSTTVKASQKLHAFHKNNVEVISDRNDHLFNP